MPIPSPILDDRSYQQLRDELVRRIPVYTPEWTDHNASDPGITLIELFSFLGENLLFRFNQIPEATKLAFLRLLQIPLRPAVPARSIITMTSDRPDGLLVKLGAEARAGSLLFETTTEVKVYPVKFTAIAKRQTAAPDKLSEPEVQDFAIRALDAIGGLQAGEEAVFYENQVLPADFSATVDSMLWVAVLAGNGADLTQMNGGVLNLGFVPDPSVPTIDQVSACPGDNAGSNGPAVEWQASTGKLDSAGQPVYRSLSLAGDTTRGLTQEGVVRLRLADPPGVGVFSVADPDARGTRSLPPVLDDATESKILFWLRAFRLNHSGIGKVQMVAANAAEVTQTSRAAAEFLGTGNAQPDQTYTLVHNPVIAGSLTIEVEDGGRFEAWTAVDDFFASAPDAHHYSVDLEAGTVRFGAYPPQIGQRIRAVEYRYGGGAAGNVASKALSKLPDYDVSDVENPLRAHGGADTETIEAALARIPGEFRRHDRAVTASDFQELALMTPGAAVGRAECLPRFYPPTRASERAGVVSVVVWPAQDLLHPNAPLPDRDLLRSVCCYLDHRRLVTTELYVIPPTYRQIAVAVGVNVKPGYGSEAVRQWVEQVLRQYLSPLPPFGPSGDGWPLGRRVYGPELEAAALQVEGIEFLDGLNVARLDEATATWIPGTVELEDWEVPELSAITVVEGPPLSPGQGIVPPPSKTPVPVPVIRQVC